MSNGSRVNIQSKLEVASQSMLGPNSKDSQVKVKVKVKAKMTLKSKQARMRPD